MKYGKEFQQILDESDFPDDWKTSAIEYRRLKKLIKNVQAELEGMGLSPAVLRQLLVTETNPPANGAGPSRSSTGTLSDVDVFEFEFEFGEHGFPKEVLIDPVYDEPEEDEIGREEAPPSQHPRFRVRMRSDDADSAPERLGSASSSPPTLGATPLSVMDLMRSEERGHQDMGSSQNGARTDSLSRITRRQSPVQSPSGRVVKTTDGVTAQYVFTGDESSPVPQIRLQVSSMDGRRSSTTPDEDTDSRGDAVSESETDLETDDEGDGDSVLEIVRELEVPASPTLLKMCSAKSPIWALASAGTSHGMAELSLGEAAAPRRRAEVEIDLDATPKMRPFGGVRRLTGDVPAADLGDAAIATVPSGRQREVDGGPSSSRDLAASTSPTSYDEPREFIIPLESDVAFFNVLTAALTSLSQFHADQQAQFHADVAALCDSISSSVTPGDGVTVLPTPLNSDVSTTVTKYDYRSTTPSQKDLYAWREIFALWIESEIFESSSERDRGERTVDEAERRLHAFAAEVVRRGLGDRRTLRGKKTRKAWDEFLRLNVRLLDLKRFQIANIDAARKILKKHDKRTALTASTGLQAFVRGTIAHHVDKDGNVSTWTFYKTSLPHVLLASMTETLLPILPSLDDYACLICMSIAFKPIRLTCGHLFCVRCLVKMQQRGNDSCPLCRQNTVLLADKACLDSTLMNFMKDWFPREVKAKQRENNAEIAKEALEDAAGVETRCRIM